MPFYVLKGKRYVFMKVKKWLLGLVTFAAMAVLCVVCAGAETYGDFEYDVLDSGTVEITGYNGSAEKVVIPDTIDGKSVTSIGGWAFSWCSSLTSITIPDSVTSIGGEAFYDCSSLTSITIPNSVTEIGSSAFYGCSSLTSITIPDGVTSIGDYAFSGCKSLASITIPNSVTEIGWNAFSGCTSLTNITIPSSVTEIGGSTFSGCTSLISITIPDSVTSIGESAFDGCTSLTSIMIPDSVTRIDSIAFGGCSSLTAIDVEVGNNNYTSVNGVLFNRDKTELICYPVGKTDKSYNIPNGVTSIGNYAFYGCSSLTSVTIPNSVTDIGIGAFLDCTNLTSITIPNSVTWIGGYAFSDCSSLKSITIPNSVTEIGSSAFEGCTSLTSITIPNGVTSIDWYAFQDCTSLTNITIPDSVTSIGDSAFYGCSSLKSITIPDSAMSIGNHAFYGCTSLTNITIPDSVTWIGSNAFGYYYDNEYKKIDNFKIYCYSGTAGEQYAKENDFDYVLLDKLPTLSKVTGAKLAGRAADALRINWTKNTNADGYIVEMYQGNKWVRVAKITNNNTTTFRKAGLKSGTAYKFRVRAYKMSGKTAVYSDYSATVTARTNPSVMTGVKLTGRAADALRINWTKNASADGYIVEMYQGGKWARVAKITSNSTTTFRKAGLKASTVYKFRVRAYKMSGKTALYGNFSATVTARTNPSIVKGVKIGGKAKDALRVNWTKNTSAQGYIVEMYKGGKWVRAAKITNNSTTTFRKAGLAKNTTYKFRVKAYYISGKTALYGNYGSVSGKTLAK